MNGICSLRKLLNLIETRHQATLTKLLQQQSKEIDLSSNINSSSSSSSSSSTVASSGVGDLPKRTKLIFPPPQLCTDNGVMAAWAGIEKLNLGSALLL